MLRNPGAALIVFVLALADEPDRVDSFAEFTMRKRMPESSNRLRIAIAGGYKGIQAESALGTASGPRQTNSPAADARLGRAAPQVQGRTWILMISSSCSNPFATAVLSPEQAAHQIRIRPFQEAGEFAKVDLHRGMRCGFPEVVFGQGKTAAQIEGILHTLLAHEREGS